MLVSEYVRACLVLVAQATGLDALRRMEGTTAFSKQLTGPRPGTECVTMHQARSAIAIGEMNARTPAAALPVAASLPLARWPVTRCMGCSPRLFMAAASSRRLCLRQHAHKCRNLAAFSNLAGSSTAWEDVRAVLFDMVSFQAVPAQQWLLILASLSWHRMECSVIASTSVVRLLVQ